MRRRSPPLNLLSHDIILISAIITIFKSARTKTKNFSTDHKTRREDSSPLVHETTGTQFYTFSGRVMKFMGIVLTSLFVLARMPENHILSNIFYEVWGP